MPRSLLHLLPLALTLAACSDDEVDTDVDETDADTDTVDTDVVDTDDTDVVSACAVTPPGTWSAPGWATSTTEALALRAALDALTGSAAMRGAEQGTVTIDEVSDLVALYESGDPSLADLTAAPFDAVVRDAFAEFVEVLDAGAQDLVSDEFAWTPGDEGGIFEASFRGINEGGLEVRQLVDKGLFAGGALYPWALAQTEGTIDEATVEAIAAAWGANEALDAEGTLTDSANYSDAQGFHDEVAAALIAAKAYAASPDCTAERDEALVTAFRTWELSMASRYVHYANAASALLAAPGSDADVASALHELGEGLGLVLGFYGQAAPTAGPLAGAGRVITDDQLEDIAASMGVSLTDLGASTTGAFVADPSGFADGVLDAEATLKTAYGVTDADIAAWRISNED